MDKYKIELISIDNQDINDILIKVLSKEIKKYLKTICKKSITPLSCMQSYLEGDRNC